MGGRGASSVTGKRQGLPGGAVAFTLGDEHPVTLFERNGTIFRSGSTGTTIAFGIVRTNLSLAQLYENAKTSGQHVKLHSPSEVKAANESARKRNEENKRDIALAELRPNTGRTGISANRLLLSKKRARGTGR